MKENNLPELKPCPFCGGSAEYGGNFAMTWVECSYCNCAVWADGVSEEAISVVWNRRAETSLQASSPEMYDALYWLLHLASGVSKGGHDYPITEREWAEAVEAGKDAIAKAKGEKR